MREPLTPKQHNLVSFISRYAEQHGYAANVEDMRRELGCRSLATVHEHVQAVIGKGYLRKERGRSRSLRVLSEEEWLAGDPVPEEPMIDQTVTAEDVRCACALLELVEEEAVEPALRDEAIRVARDLLGPVEVQERGDDPGLSGRTADGSARSAAAAQCGPNRVHQLHGRDAGHPALRN